MYDIGAPLNGGLPETQLTVDRRAGVMSAKYVFVTGGVMSSLGKGITASSLGRLLDRETGKVAQLHELSSVRILGGRELISTRGAPDTEPQSRPVVARQRHLQALEPAMASARSARPKPDHLERQVHVVAHHQQTAAVEAVTW